MRSPRRLIPVAAMVVAIGASAAGAATAAATGTGTGTGTGGSNSGSNSKVGHAGDTDKGGIAVSCEIKIKGDKGLKGPEIKKPAIDGRGALPDVTGLKSGIVPDGAVPAKPGLKNGTVLKGGTVPDGGFAVEGRIAIPDGAPDKPIPGCPKNVKVISLDTIASKLGVSKDALVQAMEQTKQWAASSGTAPTPAQFDQHLADLLHVSVDKVKAVMDPAVRIEVKPGA